MSKTKKRRKQQRPGKEKPSQTGLEPLVLVGLALLSIAVYGQTVWFEFINIDDPSYVYKNPHVLAGLTASSIKWALTAFHSSNWHPLTWLSHMADVSIFGVGPGAFHGVNTLLHALNSILAFVVFRRLTGEVWQSAVIAAIFAVHPTHVESVAWISERKDLLSTAFWFLTMLAYLRYISSSKRRMLSAAYLTVLFLFALGLMAKPMVVTLPFALLLMDYWPLRRFDSLRGALPMIVEKIPLFALAGLSSVITFMAQSSSGATASLAYIPLQTRLINATIAYVQYLGMFFYPANLSFFYPYRLDYVTWQPLAALALLAVISLVCWRQRKTRKYLLCGWLWFVGTLIPVIGIVQVGSQSLADRYTYIPYVGLSIMVVWAMAEVIDRYAVSRNIVVAGCVCIGAVLGVLAFRQASHWRNSETLYTHSVAATKNNSFLKNHLCAHFAQTLRAADAEAKCSALLENVKDLSEAQVTLGLVRYDAGKFEQAAVNFQNALQIRDGQASVYYHLAAANIQLGKLAAAASSLDRSAELFDGSISAANMGATYELLGNEFVKQGNIDQSKVMFEKALRFDPGRVEARKKLGLDAK